MPCILAIETSVPQASIALLKPDGEVLESTFESHRQQNQLLFPPLEEMMATLGAADRLDLVICGTGPGSYSGSRIGIAAGQGIAIAHQCPAVGLSSLLATTCSQHPSLAVGDARRGTFFIAKVNPGELPEEPRLMEHDAFLEALEAENQRKYFTFDDPTSLSQDTNITQTTPTARGLLKAWGSLNDETKQNLLITPAKPAYLRAPFITKAKAGHPLLRQRRKP